GPAVCETTRFTQIGPAEAALRQAQGGPEQGRRAGHDFGYFCFDAASRNPSNSGRNSPVRQKFSGCHSTPRQNRAAGSSIASMTPSGAVAATRNPGATALTA